MSHTEKRNEGSAQQEAPSEAAFSRTPELPYA